MANSMSNHRILTSEEEIELIKIIKYDTDEEKQLKASQELVRCNQRLVAYLANKYAQWDRQQYQDLCQEGIKGLYPAMVKFDENSGFRFSTYASHWIKQVIRLYMSNHSRNIRTPSYVIEKVSLAKKARDHLTQKLGYPPSVEEVVKYLVEEKDVDITAEKLFAYETALQATASLDFQIGEETTLADVIEDTATVAADVEYDRKQVRVVIGNALENLSSREERVLRMRFGIGSSQDHTLDQIAVVLNLTKERVRQIERDALIKLTKGKHKALLKGLL